MPVLSLQKNAKRIRIYIGENDRWRGKSLSGELLEVLRKEGMAGATVFRGMAGFGAHSHVRSSNIEVLSFDLPVVIEAIDSAENVAALLEIVYPMVREGLITVEDVEIIKYTHRWLNPLPADRLVSEVMTRDAITITPDLPVQKAWQKMLEHRVKAMPVIENAGKVVGILTDEDLLQRAGIQQRLSIAVHLDAESIQRELKTLEDTSLKAGDVMTTPVVTIGASETLGAATTVMIKSGLKRLPVTNQYGNLVGILSRLDILRQVANIPAAEPVSTLRAGAVRTVSDVMAKDIPMAGQDDPLPTLVEKFSKSGSHRLVVVDSEGRVSGLISDSDVVSRVQPLKRGGILDALRHIGKPPSGKETARDLMSPGVLAARPEQPIVEAVQAMLAASRKWMVVVDEQNRPLGLVDRQILLEAIASVQNHPATDGPAG